MKKKLIQKPIEAIKVFVKIDISMNIDSQTIIDNNISNPYAYTSAASLGITFFLTKKRVRALANFLYKKLPPLLCHHYCTYSNKNKRGSQHDVLIRRLKMPFRFRLLDYLI